MTGDTRSRGAHTHTPFRELPGGVENKHKSLQDIDTAFLEVQNILNKAFNEMC